MSATGTLVFHVYTSDAYLPVEGATVVVRQQEAPGNLLGLRVTNSSGETDPLVIATPDKALGQSPENVIRPWMGVTVLVEHPDYERVIIDGVQVFPGIVTMQSINLLPRREFDPEYDQEQQFEFTPQPLWEEGQP